MVREMEDTLKRAGHSQQVISFVFEGASHNICGEGDEMTRMNPIINPEGSSPEPEASARASARAWAENEEISRKAVNDPRSTETVQMR
jgi:hypothetical protein